MGSRGPKPIDPSVLAKRGSWRAKTGRREPKPVEKTGDAALPSKRTIDQCIRMLPGYDPFRNADGFHFDHDRALKAIRFFHTELSHAKGRWARTPFKLQPWQIGVVANTYGWVDDRGKRRYQEVLVYLPRKNGKSALAAGNILLCLFEDDEYGAEIYGAAAEYKQASLIFEHARLMVLQNAKLRERAQVFKGQAKSIQLGEETGYSTYRVIAADADNAHGFNTHMAVVDELHVQPDRLLVEALLTSTGARSQPLIMYTTTADYIRESICNEKLEYARRVCETGCDPRFLPVLYEANPEHDDWENPEVWKRVNPNLDVSVSMDFLRREYERAKQTPAHESAFKRLHLNMQTEADVRWITSTAWEASGSASLHAAGGDPKIWRELAMKRNAKRECVGALDLGSTSDITAFVLMFPRDDGELDVIPHFWLPRAALNNSSRSAVSMYRIWADQGWINLTEGNAIDYDRIRSDVNSLSSPFIVRGLAIDRNFQGAQLSMQLADDGFDVIAFGQGFASMAAPTKKFEELVLGTGASRGKIHHGGNPVLRWMMANCAVEQDDAGNKKPSKKKSAEKIDGVVCMIMGVGIMHTALKPKPRARMMLV